MKNGIKLLKIGMASLLALVFSLAAYAHEGDPGVVGHSGNVAAGLDEFPNLHPLVVHFAIVLIMVGAGLQLANVYFMKRDIGWIAFGTAAGGFVAAHLAAGPYHPHAHELSEHRQSGAGPARPVGRVDPWAGRDWCGAARSQPVLPDR